MDVSRGLKRAHYFLYDYRGSLEAWFWGAVLRYQLMSFILHLIDEYISLEINYPLNGSLCSVSNARKGVECTNLL